MVHFLHVRIEVNIMLDDGMDGTSDTGAGSESIGGGEWDICQPISFPLEIASPRYRKPSPRAFLQKCLRLDRLRKVSVHDVKENRM